VRGHIARPQAPRRVRHLAFPAGKDSRWRVQRAAPLFILLRREGEDKSKIGKPREPGRFAQHPWTEASVRES
jgi:hypothetical protein